MTQRQSERHETVHRAVRLLVVAWLAVMLLAAPAVAQTETATPTGETAACTTGPPVPGDTQQTDPGNAEIALVSDNSGSMTESVGDGSGRSKLDVLKAAVGNFISLVDPETELSHTKIQAPELLIGLTTDHAAVNDTVQSLTDDPAIQDMPTAIDLTTDELTTGTSATDNATKVMLVSSDGEVDPSAIDAADSARDNGILIYTIGIGDAVDDQQMIDIAGDASRYYESPNATDLEDIYESIFTDIEQQQSRLTVETRSLFQPGATHEYTVMQEVVTGNDTTVYNVTENASLNTTNASILSVDESSYTLSAVNDTNTSTWVRVDATANGTAGCTNVIVAQPTVENLQLVPGIWRFFAVFDDATMFTLLIAALLSVPAARFTSAFGGLAVAEMVIVIGWVTGRIAFGFAAVSVFVALFIGLNVVANVDYQVRR